MAEVGGMSRAINTHQSGHLSHTSLQNNAINLSPTHNVGFLYRRIVDKWHQQYRKEGRKEMFYFIMHSTHFIYGCIVSDIW